MILIGDVHGLFYDYRKILKVLKPKTSLQLGDMGVGFPDYQELVLNDIPGDHYWLRGNHDNPKVSRNHSNYIGDFGIHQGSFMGGLFNELMFVSGAWSIDKDYRTPGLSWWSEEELSYKELSDVVNLYVDKKPEIVCTHDCPTYVLNDIYLAYGHVFPTRTGDAFNTMIRHRMPAYWIFAHHHRSWRKDINGCTFICLNELEYLDISKRIS